MLPRDWPDPRDTGLGQTRDGRGVDVHLLNYGWIHITTTSEAVFFSELYFLYMNILWWYIAYRNYSISCLFLILSLCICDDHNIRE